MVCRTAVAAEHDVLHTGKAGQRLHIRIVRLKGHRVGEKEKIVNLSVHNARAHLLVTAQRTGFKDSEIPLHIRMFLPEGFEDKGTRGARTIEFMPHQQFRVPQYPLDEVFLHGVVCH